MVERPDASSPNGNVARRRWFRANAHAGELFGEELANLDDLIHWLQWSALGCPLHLAGSQYSSGASKGEKDFGNADWGSRIVDLLQNGGPNCDELNGLCAAVFNSIAAIMTQGVGHLRSYPLRGFKNFGELLAAEFA